MTHIDHTKNTMISYYMSTQPPQVIKPIPRSINKRLKKTHQAKKFSIKQKSEYETALKNSGYHKAELKFHKEEQNTQKPKTKLLHHLVQPTF